MDCAWARGGKADSQIASEFGVAARHEGGHLLVPHLDEIETVTRAVEGADEPVDAVARVPENALHAPGGKPLPEEIAHRFSHAITSKLCAVPRRLVRPTPESNHLFQGIAGRLFSIEVIW